MSGDEEAPVTAEALSAQTISEGWSLGRLSQCAADATMPPRPTDPRYPKMPGEPAALVYVWPRGVDATSDGWRCYRVGEEGGVSLVDGMLVLTSCCLWDGIEWGGDGTRIISRFSEVKVLADVP